MRKGLNNNQGFTLLEVMITVSILSIFITLLYNFLGLNLKFMNNYSDDAQARYEVRMVVQRVTLDLRKYQCLELSRQRSGETNKYDALWGDKFHDKDMLIDLPKIKDGKSRLTDAYFSMGTADELDNRQLIYLTVTADNGYTLTTSFLKNRDSYLN